MYPLLAGTYIQEVVSRLVLFSQHSQGVKPSHCKLGLTLALSGEVFLMHAMS